MKNEKPTLRRIILNYLLNDRFLEEKHQTLFKEKKMKWKKMTENALIRVAIIREKRKQKRPCQNY